ncbi:MAG: L,D-transpeptidase family protein [Deltaproteobacteria bacterium]|nr:L,D-transpeptidase family protein [Deltaproteobacteria bacterium]
MRFFSAKLTSAAMLVLYLFLLPGASPAQFFFSDDNIDRVIIEKSKRTMTLYKQGQEIKSYNIALGRDPVGHKLMQGDQKTPEGVYFIDYRISNSVYHKALHVSYPNMVDVERAKALGVSPGGKIMIHGMNEDKLWMGSVHYLFNWTNGCIAVTNSEIEEIWALVPDWTMVEIRP